MQLSLNLLAYLLLSTAVLAGQLITEYPITDYGAIGDGTQLNTEAIQRAINTASQNGGGKVIVSCGNFLTGTLELKSDVELRVDEGATLLGSTNPAHYRSIAMIGRPNSPKQDDNSQLALIAAFSASNIAITGHGTIDGQGRQLALTIDSLHHAGVAVDPNYGYEKMRPSELMRPKLVRISTCSDVTFSGVTFRSSAAWGLSFELCSQLTLDSLTVDNQAYWNNDGMDITDSKNVRITNCTVNSADDGICLKSYYPDYYNDSIFIANCTIRSGASAIKLGTASYGGFRNITIDSIEIYDTYRSAIAIESVDGGFIENLRATNITATNTGNALFIRLGHRGGEAPGTIKNIHLSNMKVTVPFIRPDINYDLRASEGNAHHNPFPASIVGIPGHYIQGVVLENIEITYPGRSAKGQAYVPLSRLDQVPEYTNSYPEFSMFGELPAWALYVRHAKSLVMNGIRLSLAEPDFRPAFVLDDVMGLKSGSIDLPAGGATKQFVIKASSDIQLAPKHQIMSVRLK